MLDVDIEKILPISSVRELLNSIVDEVANSDEMYVVTKEGRPAAIVVGVHHLEVLTGISHKDIMPDETVKEVSPDQFDSMPSAASGFVSPSTIPVASVSPINPAVQDLPAEPDIAPSTSAASPKIDNSDILTTPLGGMSNDAIPDESIDELAADMFNPISEPAQADMPEPAVQTPPATSVSSAPLMPQQNGNVAVAPQATPLASAPFIAPVRPATSSQPATSATPAANPQGDQSLTSGS